MRDTVTVNERVYTKRGQRWTFEPKNNHGRKEVFRGSRLHHALERIRELETRAYAVSPERRKGEDVNFTDTGDDDGRTQMERTQAQSGPAAAGVGGGAEMPEVREEGGDGPVGRGPVLRGASVPVLPACPDVGAAGVTAALAAAPRVRMLDEWRVVDATGRSIYGTFRSQADAQFYADGSDYRVVRVALVDEPEGTNDA